MGTGALSPRGPVIVAAGVGVKIVEAPGGQICEHACMVVVCCFLSVARWRCTVYLPLAGVFLGVGYRLLSQCWQYSIQLVWFLLCARIHELLPFNYRSVSFVLHILQDGVKFLVHIVKFLTHFMEILAKTMDVSTNTTCFFMDPLFWHEARPVTISGCFLLFATVVLS